MKGLFIFLGGALVGATAMALMATMTGKELREKIRNILVEKGIIASEDIEQFVERIALEIESEKE